MAKRKSTAGEHCPVARTVGVIGDGWSLLVIRDAFDGVCRFGDFQRSLGIARNILSDRLQWLQEEGILSVQPASDGTSYQEYVLTEKGKALFPLIVAFRQWGEHYLFESDEPRSMLIDRKTKKPLALMNVRSSTGRILQPHETEILKVDENK
jgi:DNA-binding HxlR family transcriptional regulator